MLHQYVPKKGTAANTDAKTENQKRKLNLHCKWNEMKIYPMEETQPEHRILYVWAM